jgi:hypothetical protein
MEQSDQLSRHGTIVRMNRMTVADCPVQTQRLLLTLRRTFTLLSDMVFKDLDGAQSQLGSLSRITVGIGASKTLSA